MFRPTLLLCFVALSFTHCNKDASMATEPTASVSSTNIFESSEESSSYILMGNNVNSKLNQIRQKIASLGATETGYIAALNQMYVSSTNPNFISSFEALDITVGIDFEINSPSTISNSRTRTGSSPSTIGNSNPYFPIQWNLQAISAPQAWAAGYKGRGVMVAVLDGGMYLNHPDLKANINKRLSHNFVRLAGENNPSDASFTLSPEFSHATHVAGIIAAVDNNIGVIGVAPKAEIMAVKVLSDGGDGNVSWIIQGIVYAADNGAKVINMSLGGLYTRGPGQHFKSTKNAFRDAIQYANNKGVTVVCGAGNNAINFDHTNAEFFPAATPTSISVSATSPENWYDKMTQGLPFDLDIPTFYTNFGASFIDFAAPGGDVDAPGDNGYYDMVYSTGGPDDYYWSAGTSMAAPHVSGIVALIIGKNGGSMDPDKVKKILKKSADDLGKPGHDKYFGDGRVNAFKAIE